MILHSCIAGYVVTWGGTHDHVQLRTSDFVIAGYKVTQTVQVPSSGFVCQVIGTPHQVSIGVDLSSRAHFVTTSVVQALAEHMSLPLQLCPNKGVYVCTPHLTTTIS